MTRNANIKLLLALFALAGSAFADTAADIRALEKQKVSLSAEIKKINVKIQTSDSLVREDNKRYALLETRYSADLDRRRADLDTLSQKLRLIASELQAESGKQAGYKGKLANDESRRKEMRRVLANLCKTFETQVKQTLPWDLENRLSRITSLRNDLETGNGTEEEAFSRLSALISEETRFGDEVQIINAPMTRKNGEVINARILRIGNEWMIYSDENATVFGSLERSISNDSATYAWNEELSLSEREAIRNAFDVKQGRKPPQMVTVPLKINGIGGKK